MKTLEKKKEILSRNRVLRVRKKLRGSSSRPRMAVVKTNLHLYVQLIDDEKGETLASLSTISKDFKSSEFNRKNKGSAHALGERIAEIAMEKGIKEVIFDRGKGKYHGILAEVADAARGSGLSF